MMVLGVRRLVSCVALSERARYIHTLFLCVGPKPRVFCGACQAHFLLIKFRLFQEIWKQLQISRFYIQPLARSI